MGFVEWIQQQAVIYAVCGLALLAMAILLYKIVKKLFFEGTKSDRLEYLKSFKKGQVAIIYIIAMPLYFFGFLMSNDIMTGMDVLQQFLNSVAASINLVKLSFGMGGIVKAMNDKFYFFTVLVCFIITVLNVLLFSASLLWQRFKNFCKVQSAIHSRNLYVVVGYNDKNILLLNTLKNLNDKKAKGLMLAKPDADRRDKLYLNGLCFSTFDSVNATGREFYKKIESLLGWNRNVTVVINTEDDARNLLFLQGMDELLHSETSVISLRKPAGVSENEESLQKPAHVQKNEKSPQNLADVPVIAEAPLLTVYAFCQVENQSMFTELAERSEGHINLLNRYEQIAFDFVNKYPLTHFMTGEHIDLSNGLIKNETEINVCLIGFGPTNRQIFLKTIANSQFFTKVNQKLVHKKVHYYVFDKADAHNDKNLNQNYFRYSLEFYKQYKKYKEKMLGEGKNEKSKDWNYLPLPDYPADDWFNPERNTELSGKDPYFAEHFCKMDINSYEFYDKLQEVINKDNSYTYIITAFGEDLENIDLAKKIFARLSMWGKSKDTHVFAKVRNGALFDAGNADDSGIIMFGSTESVYDMNKIANNEIMKMVFSKSFVYTRESGEDENEIRRQAVLDWMKSSIEQRMSNFYCCLNLRTKLNLLGFDYVKKQTNSDTGDLDEFKTKYYGPDGKIEVCEKMYRDGSVRTLLAIQEHQRWNANYICAGIIPLTKSEIIAGVKKDMEHRLVHCNLTTFEGLEEYRVLTGKDVREKDVREYDYRIMDLAGEILSDAGYKIVRK